MSAAASRRHVDASLDLFTRKSPRSWRGLSEKEEDGMRERSVSLGREQGRGVVLQPAATKRGGIFSQTADSGVLCGVWGIREGLNYGRKILKIIKI